MQLLVALCCFSVIVTSRAADIENSSQGTDGVSVGLGAKPQTLTAQDGDMAQNPSPLALLLAQTLRNRSEHTQGAAELPIKEVQSIAGNDLTANGDPRLKRSPHRHRKGCFSCGYGGGGGYYVQPVYAKPIYVETVYVKPVAYVQPVYQKPVYSHPHYGSGCSTCGGGAGSFSYSQSSASSSSYSYGYGKK